MLKGALIVLGMILLAVGAIGLFVPGLPTTPFVLLAAGLFLRSSKRLYTRVVNGRLFGKYVSDFVEKKGMTRKTKIVSIAVMWTMITLSSLLIGNLVIGIILAAVGIIGTIVMGKIVKTV